MSLITYEFKSADNSGEIHQFHATLPTLQKHYQGRNEVVLYLSGRLNINGVDVDGLIIKKDAIVLIEFKNYSGAIKAQANGDWFCGEERINGGAKKKDGTDKTVFEQLKINRRVLKEGLLHYTKNIDACKNIQALVVFSAISSLRMDEEFKWGANAWVNVTDVEHIDEELDTIKAKNKNVPIVISKDEIFDFIRNKELDERYILTKYSDVNIMPADLYHENEPHNGDDFSPNTLLDKEKKEKEKCQTALHEAVELMKRLTQKMEKMKGERDVIKQKLELLEIEAEKLKERRHDSENIEGKTSEVTSAHEEGALLEEAKAVEKEVEQIENKPVKDEPTAVVSIKNKKRFAGKAKVLKDFNVASDSMDDDQLELIEKNLDESMIVAGCAGSGKSIIAMYKAQQIKDNGGDVILIAYTKSLNRYMRQGKESSLEDRFYYHWKWRNCGMPKADYVIVDEIQDFNKEEIMEFIHATRKYFFFFGDTAQSIYKAFGKNTMTIEEISRLTGVPISMLYNNYRLPKPIAKITQDHLGLNEEHDNVRPFSERSYLSKEATLPIFVECASEQEQTREIISIIKDEQLTNVGILVPDNEMVLQLMRYFNAKNFVCEFKYNAGYNDAHNKDSLNFKTFHPKLMTYHSAKGLQFETVILPYYKGTQNIEELKALYVAMTRTYRYLYVLYSDVLELPLSKVPPELYTKWDHPHNAVD